MADLQDRLSKLRQSIPQISSKDLQLWMLQKKAPPVVIDIREGQELDEGFLAGAKQISFSYLELEIESEVPDKNYPVVLYCASGRRSLIAADHLKKLGYTDIQSLAGGFLQWKGEGMPVAMPNEDAEWIRSRFKRHLNLPEVGMEGQLKLLASRILIVGGGGIGNPAALYLASAGVGTLGIADSDQVDLSNLQRQILFSERDVGLQKIDILERELKSRQSKIHIIKIPHIIDQRNVGGLLPEYDLVIDATDNFEARYVLNRACFAAKKTLIHGSIFRFQAQVSAFDYSVSSPCYECLYPEPPPDDFAPSCNEAGVFGVLPGLVGLLAATEAIKFLLGFGINLTGRWLNLDLKQMHFSEFFPEKNPNCSTCGQSR